jgi:hypothetical protein
MACLEIKRLVLELEGRCLRPMEKASIALSLLFYSEGLVLNDAASVAR